MHPLLPLLLLAFVSSAVSADSLFISAQAQAPAQMGCTDGVDCYCDCLTDSQDPCGIYDASVVHCEDFKDVVFDSQNNTVNSLIGWGDGVCETDGDWPVCTASNGPGTLSAAITQGYQDAPNHFKDTGAVKYLLNHCTGHSFGQCQHTFTVGNNSFTPISDSAFFSFMFYPGPDFFDKFAPYQKWAVMFESSLNRPGFGIQEGWDQCDPVYGVAFAALANGYGRDEFGEYTGEASHRCDHSAKFQSSDMSEEWFYVLIESTTEHIRVYLWDRGGTYTGLQATCSDPSDCQRSGDVTAFYVPYFIQNSILNPTANSYIYYDNYVIGTSYRGPPAGFVQ